MIKVDRLEAIEVFLFRLYRLVMRVPDILVAQLFRMHGDGVSLKTIRGHLNDDLCGGG